MAFPFSVLKLNIVSLNFIRFITSRRKIQWKTLNGSSDFIKRRAELDLPLARGLRDGIQDAQLNVNFRSTINHFFLFLEY